MKKFIKYLHLILNIKCKILCIEYSNNHIFQKFFRVASKYFYMENIKVY